MRALKDIGWNGFSVNDALTPLANMGQSLFDPPDVAGWDLGRSWFSTGSMLARMNFASSLAANQKFNLAAAARGNAGTPEALLAFVLDALKTPTYDARSPPRSRTTCAPPAPGPAARRSCRRRFPGSIHLVAGTPEYQFV